MKVDDAPVFMKSVGAMLILTSIVELIFMFVTIVNTNYIRNDGVNIILMILIESCYYFIMICMTYGLMIKKRWCCIVWLIMAVVNIVMNIISYTGWIKYIPSAILLIDMIVLVAIPRVRNYCFKKEMTDSENVPTPVE